jgi:hypothetical protein
MSVYQNVTDCVEIQSENMFSSNDMLRLTFPYCPSSLRPLHWCSPSSQILCVHSICVFPSCVTSPTDSWTECCVEWKANTKCSIICAVYEWSRHQQILAKGRFRVDFPQNDSWRSISERGSCQGEHQHRVHAGTHVCTRVSVQDKMDGHGPSHLSLARSASSLRL